MVSRPPLEFVPRRVARLGHVTSIEPKGIVRLERAGDPKIVFQRMIRGIEVLFQQDDEATYIDTMLGMLSRSSET